MKRTIYLTWFICVLFSCNREKRATHLHDRITSIQQLKRIFKNPPSEYRTAPLWVWNNDVTKNDIDRTLTGLKKEGIGGVFIHPRYGLITEYLSEDWWEMVKYSLQKAEELDMKLWIYDENSFPSGFAGGHVAAQMPEANNEGIRLKPYYLSELKIPNELKRIKQIFRKQGESWIEITDVAEKESGKKGDFCVLNLEDYETSKWFGGYSYVDLLKPGVTEKFIEITMPGYEKSLGREFGKRVPGIFTDEPNTNTRKGGTIRYTPDLYEQFEKQWGYKLEPHLMSLITETGDWKKVRHNYQSTTLQLFIDRWSKPWFKYTEDRDLLWTGHYWEHGWPSPQEGPDNMAMYAWHQQPGIDMLFNSEKIRPDQFGNVRSVKELASVVNQFDRHRALCETYGGGGWELTFNDMKRLGDWEFVLGVNFMNQHLSYISLTGDRKYDYPPSFSIHAPYWRAYGFLADYFARLSAALSSGFQNNKILVLEPTTTAWMYYNPTSYENADMYEIRTKFHLFLDKMEKFQVEYDLGCENIIRDHGRVENGRFIINRADYNLIILPPGLENLDKTTFDLLKEFINAEGNILQIDANPCFINAEKKSYKELQNNKNWKIYNEVTDQLFLGLSKNENIEFENLDSIKGRVYHQRRELKDGQLLFVSNFDQKEAVKLNINMHGKSVINLNPVNGIIEPWHFKTQEGKLHFSVKLQPSGSQLLFISPNEGKSKNPLTYKKEPVSGGVTNIIPLSPNILKLDYVELTMGNFNKTPMHFSKAANEIWKEHGYQENPWLSSSQFKTELADADTFPEGSGFTICCPFFVNNEFDNKKVELVVERPWLYQITVNGESVSPINNKFWLDPDFQILNIGVLIKKGRNEIVLTASPFSIFCELEPVYLLGDFAVLPAEKGWKLGKRKKINPGSWKDQGMPFYGQTVSYTKTITTEVAGDYLVELPAWQGTVAEILIDERCKGIIHSMPYEFKVHIPSGKYRVTVNIIGSNRNTIGPHHYFTTPGVVKPKNFKMAPETQPPGVQYNLLDYGLMSDFNIYKLNN